MMNDSSDHPSYGGIPLEPIGGVGPIRQPSVDKGDDREHVSPPIFAPETEAERKARHAIIAGQAKQAYKEHKRFLADPGWRTVEYTRAPGISCHELPTRVERIGDEEQPVYAVMASGVVEGKTADSIARAHLDSNK